jgi:signal transduction histidine kinase
MITFLREWFVNNSPLVQFFYGQVFFILGISVILQSRQYSRLNLARSLPWLAGFGILHGLYEWGDIFIPIQLATLDSAFGIVLDLIHQVVLAISFASLFQFGVELLRPYSPGWRWLRLLPTIILCAWLVGPFWLGFILIKDIQVWYSVANTFARYLLCVPATIMTVVGLFVQVKVQIEPLKLPQIGKMLKLAATAIAIYGLVEALSITKGNFFPASMVNAALFTKIFFFPPYVFRAIAGLILLFAMLRALSVFNIETGRMIRRIEEWQVIATERERIARDLHDGALQQVYASGLMAQSLQKRLKGTAAEETSNLILTINQAIDQLRAFLPQLKPELKSVDLVGALTPIIEEARRSITVNTFWETPAVPSLSPDQTRHITAFVSEALSNVIRHAKTDLVEIRLSCSKGNLLLQVQDFGQGIPSSAEPGFGLKNMRDRARLLGAKLRFDSKMGKGTEVYLELPMEGKDESDPPVDCG